MKRFQVQASIIFFRNAWWLPLTPLQIIEHKVGNNIQKYTSRYNIFYKTTDCWWSSSLSMPKQLFWSNLKIDYMFQQNLLFVYWSTNSLLLSSCSYWVYCLLTQMAIACDTSAFLHSSLDVAQFRTQWLEISPSQSIRAKINPYWYWSYHLWFLPKIHWLCVSLILQLYFTRVQELHSI